MFGAQEAMTTNDYWTTFPLVRGETVQRMLTNHYLRELDRYKDVDRNFLVVGILRTVAPLLPEWARELYVMHLNDAENVELPHQVRVHHFDIAGSLLWQAQTFYDARVATALNVWKEAGGF